MRRPLVVFAAAVLSGTLYGLPGIPFVYEIISVTVLAGMGILLVNQCRGKSKMPLCFFSVLCLLFFAAGFFRAVSETERFLEDDDFFEKYEASNPGEFDYAEYLKSVNVTTEEERKALKTRNRETEMVFIRILGDFKEDCSEILDRYFSPEDAGIIKAMVLGEKQEMDEEIKSLYRESGISHLLAVSGLHVSMVGSGTALFLSKTTISGRKETAVISTAAVCLYAVFTGASVSSLRAALMYGLGAFTVFCGRKKDLAGSLAFAAVCLVLFRPYALKQSGFQLSFLAIGGIIYAGWIAKDREKGRAAAYCIGVTLFTMPAVAFSYYKVPFYSVLLNMAVIPLMTFVFLSGVCVLALGKTVSVFLPMSGTISASCSVIQTVPVIAGVPAHFILKIYSLLSEISLQLPGAEIITGKPEHVQIVFYYAVLLTAGIIIRYTKDRAASAVLLAAVYIASFPLLLCRRENETYVTVLDVGQGDCFHLHAGGKDILIDCGSSGYERAGSRVLENYLLSKRIVNLDLTIVSHADSDHTNGILYLYSDASSVNSEKLCIPYLARSDEKYDSLKEASGNDFVYCKKGDVYSAEGFSLQCIYCEEDRSAMKDTNRESSVWLFTAGEFTMLFTGDITVTEEKKILEAGTLGTLDIDILKCAHHGSDTANSAAFLKAADPDAAVLSYGKNNRYGHPKAQVISCLENENIMILTTEKCGAITFVIFENDYQISSFKRNK